MGVVLSVFAWQFDIRGQKLVLLHSAWSPMQQNGSVPGFAGEQVLPRVGDDTELLEMLRSLEQNPLSEDDKTDVQSPRKEQWRVVRMKVTAYCPCRKCCGRHADGLTACNHRIRPGDVFVAADKRYSFGTEMIIPGYNSNQPVTVKDRGRLIKGNRLDVFFHSHQQAQKWGTKTLDVWVKVE